MDKSITPRMNLDRVLLVLGALLISGGVFANYYFSEIAWSLRFAGGLLLIGVVLGLIATTGVGKRFWLFAKNARLELLKVVWPKRDEVVKITALIAVLVVVSSIILWGIDTVLLSIIGWLVKFLV